MPFVRGCLLRRHASTVNVRNAGKCGSQRGVLKERRGGGREFDDQVRLIAVFAERVFACLGAVDEIAAVKMEFVSYSVVTTVVWNDVKAVDRAFEAPTGRFEGTHD